MGIVDSGRIGLGGIPVAADSRNKNIEIVAGVVRQDAVDFTKWSFLRDTYHAETGFNPTFSNTPGEENLYASGGTLTLRYLKAYKRAISLIIAPDETLSNAWHVTCGGSVGLEYVNVSASWSRKLAGYVYYDGAAWQALQGTYQGAVPGIAYNAGTLTITHDDGATHTDFCPGVNVTLAAWSRSGGVNPYVPVLRDVSNGLFTVNFLNPVTGALVNAAADNRMALWWSKSFDGPANLDGSNGHSAIPFYNPGNFWIYGIMEAF